MANFLASRVTFTEDALAEVRGSKGYKRMIALYLLALTLLKLLPDTVNKVGSFQWIGLFSYRTWIIIALVILLIGVIDGGQRLIEKRTSNPNRPKLEGGIYDMRFPELFDPVKVELARRTQDTIGQPVVLPTAGLSMTDDVIGSHVLLRVHFVNESQTETPIRNFLLKAKTNEGEFEALYPEDGEIGQSSGKSPDREKQFNNLIELIKSGESITFNKHVEGHLHFAVRGLIPRKTTWINLEVAVVDAWGDSHPLSLKLSKGTAPLPSERLIVFPPTQYGDIDL